MQNTEDIDLDVLLGSDEEEVTGENITVTADELKIYKAWVKMALAKRADKFEPVANATRALWKGKNKLEWGDEGDAVNLNLVFSNLEIAMPNIFFRNPRIFVKATQPVFMLEDGTKLDGTKAARLLEDGANYVAYSTNLKRTVKLIRNDTLTTTYGVAMCGYEGETGINEEGNDYIKSESIFTIRISPFKFLCDVEALDCLTFADARWVGREIDIRYEDFMEDDYYENKDKTKSNNIAYNEKMVAGDNEKKVLIDFAGKDYKDTMDAKRLTLYELWIKPTVAERAKLEPNEPGGRVVVFSMSGKKVHKAFSWPYKIKKFPFRGLAFFRDNEEFFPISDIMQYVRQLKELNIIRTAQLKVAKSHGAKKVLINVDKLGSEEGLDEALNSDNMFIKLNAGEQDIRGVATPLNYGSVPAELFAIDRKIIEDIDKTSGITDIRRAIPPPGMETATEGKLLYGSGTARFSEKKEEVGDFFGDIARIIIQLIKQFWTTETVVRRLGTLTPEWTDSFSREDVQIEDDVEIDIGEMVPVDEIVRKRMALELMGMVVKGAGEEAVKSKLAEEGYELVLSEAIKEGLSAYGIMNDRILRKLDPDRFVEVLRGLMANKMKTQGVERGSPGRGGGAKTGKGGKGERSIIASELSAANRTPSSNFSLPPGAEV